MGFALEYHGCPSMIWPFGKNNRLHPRSTLAGSIHLTSPWMKDSKCNVRAGPRKDLSSTQITEQCLELTSHHHVYRKLSRVGVQVFGKAAAFDGAANVSPQGSQSSPCWRLPSASNNSRVYHLQALQSLALNLFPQLSFFFLNLFPLGS